MFMKFIIIVLFFCSCTCINKLDLKQKNNFKCKRAILDSSRHIDSIVIYALTSSDLVFNRTGGSYNPLYIKTNGKRFVNRDSIVLKSIDSIVFSNLEFNAYSSYSFSLLTEYSELGEHGGFYHVYEIYFKDSASNFVTQIATVHGAYFYIGFSKYGSCDEFIQKLKKLNAGYIKF